MINHCVSLKYIETGTSLSNLIYSKYFSCLIFFLTWRKLIYNKLTLNKVKNMKTNLINILLVLIIVEVIINTSGRRGT
jgi:hypothetical protein